VGERSRAAFGCSQGGCHVGGRRVAEDEEFYEGTDEDYDGELAEEETLREGEAWGRGELVPLRVEGSNSRGLGFGGKPLDGRHFLRMAIGYCIIDKLSMLEEVEGRSFESSSISGSNVVRVMERE